MGEIVMVISGKGGVGKTTTAALLGLQFSRMDKKVVLVDTDFGFRNLDIFFCMENQIRYNVADVLRGVCSVRQACITVDENLSMIPGTKDDSFSCDEGRIASFLQELSGSFDYIIIDTPAGISSIHHMLLPYINQGILVMAWDQASISDAISMSKLLQRGHMDFKVVLNEQKPIRFLVPKQELIGLCDTVLNSEYIGRIPYQRQLVFDNHKLNKSLQMICSKL